VKLAYIAGPYRAATEYGIWQNIEAARIVAVEVLRAGWFPLTPHLNTCFLGGVVPDSVVLAGYLEIVRACPAIVMMRRWKESEGAQAEHALAVELDKLIVYEAEDGWLRRLSMTA
jgi:hypothetical protein